MADPVELIREAWAAAIAETTGLDISVDWESNVWQLIQREADDGSGVPRGIQVPALVWSSQGMEVARSADGRRRQIESFVLEFRSQDDARGLAEVYRGHLAAAAWEYLADDFGIDLLLATGARDLLEHVIYRRVALATFVL